MDSFGLLDDNLLFQEDTTIGNDNSKIQAPLNVLSNSSRDNLIRNKPPLPMQSVYNTIFKQNKIKTQQRNGNPISSQSNYNGNENENDENCDETVASVKLNESDLNQLDKDYNFEFSEEDDDDDENSEEEKKQTFTPNPIKCQEQTPRNSSSTKEPLTHLKMNNNEFKIISKQNAEFLQKFDILEATQDENENLSNESVNILRISDSKLDLESDSKQFNYGSFDKVNDSANQSVFKLPDSSCERVNQIVRQSMERTARAAMEKSEVLLKNDYLNLSASTSDTNNLHAKNERSTVVVEDSSNESQLADQTSSNLMPYANSRVLGSIYYKPWPIVDTTSVFKQQNDENLNESEFKLDSSLFNIPKDLNNFGNQNLQNGVVDEIKNSVVNTFPFDRPLDDEEYRNNLFASSKNTNEKRLTTSDIFSANQFNEDLGEFNPVSENFFEKDEQENRMEFDLSVNRNDLNNDNNKMRQSVSDESGEASSKNSSGEKWWNNANNMLQNSKLEVSNMSILSTSTLNSTNVTAATSSYLTNNILTSQSTRQPNSSNSIMATTLNDTENNSLSNNKRHMKSCNDTNLEHSPTKRHKHKVDVAAYFGGKSQMPPELDNKGKESESVWSDEASNEVDNSKGSAVSSLKNDLNEKTICMENTNDADKTSTRVVEGDSSLNLSTTNNGSILPNDLYNFTINLSVNGDAIIPTKGVKISDTTPFVMKKNEPKGVKTTSLNLKSIGQELERVQNRLATSSSSASSKTRSALTSSTSTSFLMSSSKSSASSGSDSSKFQIADPLLSSSSIKSSHSSTNLKSLMNMDETVSSINSSNMTTSSSSSNYSKKSKSNVMGSSKIGKDSKKLSNKTKSPQTNQTDSTTPTNSVKQKTSASGSLTSTPSKLIKSVSDSSDLNSVSTTQASISTTTTFNNHDSFISSIPERANDSTLVGNHHNNSNNNLSNINTIPTDIQDHLKKYQTISNEKGVALNSNEGATSLTTTTNKTPIVSSNASISSSNPLVHSNNITPTLSTSTNSIPVNQMFTSIFSNSSMGPGQQNNDMVPVALLPFSTVQQMIFQQKLLHDLYPTNKSHIDASSLSRQSMESNLGNKLWVNTGYSNSTSTHNINGLIGANGVLSEMSSPLSSTSIIAPNKFEIPQIELDSTEISFGPVAEGCSDFRRIFFKLINPNANGYLLLELENSQLWEIEPVNPSASKETAKNFDFVKEKIQQYASINRFKSVLSLNNECTNVPTESSTNQLKLDITGNLYDFYLQLNTKDLYFYKELNKLYAPGEIPEPVSIRSKIIISYCSHPLYNTSNADSSTTSSNINNYKRQQLLDRIKVNFILGFARVRTSSHIESIDFQVLKQEESDKIVKDQEFRNRTNLNLTKKLKLNQDKDRTLTSMDQEHSFYQESIIKSDFERYLPLSNSGNIDVRVACYYAYEKIGGEQRIDILDTISFKEGYELKLLDSLLYLEKNSEKKFPKLVLNKLDSNGASDFSMYNSKIFMIVQIKPNGFKFGIPINFSTQSEVSSILFSSKQAETPPLGQISFNTFSKEKSPATNEKSQQLGKNLKTKGDKVGDVKLASSKSLMFFGKMLNIQKNASCAPLQNEFTIQNSNEFPIDCILGVYTSGQNNSNIEPTKDIKPSFKFATDMLEKNENGIVRFSLDESFSQMSAKLEPGEKITIRIDFIAALKTSSTNSTNFVNGSVKMKLKNFTKIFHVALVGFLCESFLEFSSFPNNSKLCNEKSYMENLLENKNIKSFKCNIQLLNSSGKAYSNILKLKNKTKCLIFPMLFDNNSKCEVPFLSKGKEISFFLDKYEILLRLNFNSSFQRYKFCDQHYINEELIWFEVERNSSNNDDDGELPITIEVFNSLKNTKSIRLDELDLRHLSMCLFWFESDINSFISTHLKPTYNKSKSLETSSTVIEKLVSKLMNKYDSAIDNLNVTRESIASNSMRSINGEEISFNSSLISNTSANKIKMSRDDCVKLLKQSIKCCHLTLETRGVRDKDYSVKFIEV